MYRYYFNDDKKIVYCISTYAGKTVKGVAKCAEEDYYIPCEGAKIAKARCDVKVSEKRVKNATKKWCAAKEEYMRAQKRFEKMACYFEDAVRELSDNKKNLNKLLK